VNANRWRFALFTLGSAVFLVAFIRSLVIAIRTEAVTYTRRGQTHTYTLAGEPTRYYLELGIYVLVIAVSCVGMCIFLRALTKPHDPRSMKMIESQIASMEQRAPSGLRPLWIGLLLFAAAFAIYAMLT